jgi:hypothetical protein
MLSVKRILRRREFRAVLLLCTVLLANLALAACDVEFSSPDATPTSRIPVPSENQVDEPEPSETPTPELQEAAKDPAGTEIPPTATIEPSPTATPEPTVPIPGMIGPDAYPDDVNPLTGREVSDPDILARRPLAIKISNNARVRPQSGLNRADLVFEHLTEGGITRFTAIYYGADADKVGSIRSGRLIDLELPIMYDAAFGYSGSSSQLRWMFARGIFFDRIVSPDFAHGGFDRISNPNNPGERVEDTLYTSTGILHWILDQRGQDTQPEFTNGMAFHPDPPEGGVEASNVEIRYPATNVFWYHSPGLGGYQRWSDGIPHVDANNGSQLLFQNVVIVKAPHLDTEIIEDSGGSPSIQIQIWGEGPATIYRDGLRYDGIWRRLDNRHMLTFHTIEGDLLPLSPGKTFFEVVPDDFDEVYDSP